MLLRTNVLAFALVAGAIGAVRVLTGDVSLISIWGIPVGTVIGLNAGYAVRRSRGDEQPITDIELEELNTALAWGFIVTALALPVVLTYDAFTGTTVEGVAGWVVGAGVVTTFTLAVGLGLRRWVGSSKDGM